ncbi:hypothetical protein [Streptomyces sp. NBC_01092]|nr:hypothetical protein OG254_14330 [Streptomyces sp. NBC_01092]
MVQEAVEARERAEQTLADAVARGPEIEAVTAELAAVLEPFRTDDEEATR